MKITEKFNMLGHEAKVEMENNTTDSPLHFYCAVTIDDGEVLKESCIFSEGETISAEKPLLSILQDAYDIEHCNSFEEFVKKYDFDREDDKDIVQIVYNGMKKQCEWLHRNFNEKEIEELYSCVAPKDCNAKKNKISEDEKDDELEFI